MKYLVAAHRETAATVGHDALALGVADRRAQIGFARQAGFALAAFRNVERNYVIALFQGLHARAAIHDHASAFVAQNGRENAFWVGTRQRELVCMANAGRFDLDQDFALPRAVKCDGFNR